MGMLESPATLPDTIGLPEYRVKDFCTEIDGHDIRIAFSGNRFGHIEWLYTVLMSPEELFDVCARLQAAAVEAQRIIHVMTRCDRAH